MGHTMPPMDDVANRLTRWWVDVLTDVFGPLEPGQQEILAARIIEGVSAALPDLETVTSFALDYDYNAPSILADAMDAASINHRHRTGPLKCFTVTLPDGSTQAKRGYGAPLETLTDPR